MKRLIGILFAFLILAVVALPLVADNGPNHRVRQARPISLGTSGGNVRDRTNLFCCSGTLGSLVRNGAGTQFVLSNNHVLALSNNGAVGDDVTQPGMIDQNCAAPLADVVADLSAFITITKSRNASNQADAAIAQVRSGAVSSTGDILDVGCLTGSRAATVGMAVQKSGRTSGFTTGTVQSTSVTILVSYPNNCGSFSGKAARFVNQIRVTPGSFLQGGDSGSLMVENTADGRSDAVGLLFAGSSSDSFANPISYVLANLPGEPYSMVTCSGFTESVPAPEEDWDPRYLDAAAAQASLNDFLEANYSNFRGVIGHGIGRSDVDGDYALEVYVRKILPHHLRNLPIDWEGFEVKIVEVGRVVAF